MYAINIVKRASFARRPSTTVKNNVHRLRTGVHLLRVNIAVCNKQAFELSEILLYLNNIDT
jgi:hypothetical protein